MPNSARNPSGPRRLVSPWYLAYLVLGLINSGMLPFLLPLAVARAGYGLGGIAYVIGAYNFGLMPAPLLGVLAERQRLFRPVFSTVLSRLRSRSPYCQNSRVSSPGSGSRCW